MKSIQEFLLLTAVVTILFLPGCSVIVGIFSAGIWTAIILVLLLAGLLTYGWKKTGGP